MSSNSNAHSGIGQSPVKNSHPSMSAAPASRNPPAGRLFSFSGAVKHVNDPYRTRTMAIPVIPEKPALRY